MSSTENRAADENKRLNEHISLARSRTWNGGDPWQFIAYCRLLLGLPEEGPAPYGLIDDAITLGRQPVTYAQTHAK